MAYALGEETSTVSWAIYQAKRLGMITEAECRECFAAAKAMPWVDCIRAQSLATAPQVVEMVRSGRYRSQPQIADARGVTEATISQVLKHAREQGMISKEECAVCFRAAR